MNYHILYISYKVHLRRVALRQKLILKGTSNENIITIYKLKIEFYQNEKAVI